MSKDICEIVEGVVMRHTPKMTFVGEPSLITFSQNSTSELQIPFKVSTTPYILVDKNQEMNHFLMHYLHLFLLDTFSVKLFPHSFAMLLAWRSMIASTSCQKGGPAHSDGYT